MTAASNPQNDRLYVPAAVRMKGVSAKCLLRTRSTYSQSHVVSVGVSKLGRTGLIFLEPGVKVNGAYYSTVTSCCCYMLPIITSHRQRVLHISAGQCSSALGSWDDQSSRTRDSCFHLTGFVATEQPRPKSNWLQNLGPGAATSLPDDSAVAASNRTIWGRMWLTCGTDWNKALSLISGADVSVHVFRPKEDTLNVHSDLLISLICSVKICR